MRRLPLKMLSRQREVIHAKAWQHKNSLWSGKPGMVKGYLREKGVVTTKAGRFNLVLDMTGIHQRKDGPLFYTSLKCLFSACLVYSYFYFCFVMCVGKGSRYMNLLEFFSVLGY